MTTRIQDYLASLIHDEGWTPPSSTYIWFQRGAASSPTAETPTFSPAAGSYGTTQTVTISTTTPGAQIRYTTNGTTPTASSTLYSAPITVSASQTVRAIAISNGYISSAVGAASYVIGGTAQAAAPTFSVPAGTYGTTQSVTLSTTTPAATIYYTTDGSTPTISSSSYSTAITVSSSQTIRAFAVAGGYADSTVSSAAYVINSASVVFTDTCSSLAGWTQILPNLYLTADGTLHKTGDAANVEDFTRTITAFSTSDGLFHSLEYDVVITSKTPGDPGTNFTTFYLGFAASTGCPPTATDWHTGCYVMSPTGYSITEGFVWYEGVDWHGIVANADVVVGRTYHVTVACLGNGTIRYTVRDTVTSAETSATETVGTVTIRAVFGRLYGTTGTSATIDNIVYRSS